MKLYCFADLRHELAEETRFSSLVELSQLYVSISTLVKVICYDPVLTDYE